MWIALALLACCDQFDDAASKVKFPADDVLADWAKKSDAHRKALRLITDRKGWARAFETVQKKLTLGPGKVDIDVVLHDSEEYKLADSKGQFGYGTVRFNMQQLVPQLKQLEEQDQQTKEGRLAPLILPAQRLEGLITHELTHVLSGAGEENWVAEGLATYAANENYFLYNYNRKGVKIESIDRPMNDTDSYPRGLCFFRWVEKEHGAEKVQDIAVRVASGTEKTRTVVADVLGKSWDQIAAREKTWSTAYLATFTTAR